MHEELSEGPAGPPKDMATRLQEASAEARESVMWVKKLHSVCGGGAVVSHVGWYADISEGVVGLVMWVSPGVQGPGAAQTCLCSCSGRQRRA